MADVFGSDNSIGVSAVGMMLPGGIPVGSEAMFELNKSKWIKIGIE